MMGNMIALSDCVEQVWFLFSGFKLNMERHHSDFIDHIPGTKSQKR